MMRKILHIQKVKGIAGSENHLLILLPHLHEYGYNPTMLVLADPEDRPEAFCKQMRSCNVHTEVMPMRGDIDALMLCRLIRYIRRSKFDLVHTHIFHADLYGTFASKIAGTSTIISTKHGFDPWRSNGWYAWLDRLSAMSQKSIITISNAIGEWLAEVGKLPTKNMVTIHYALDIEAFRAKADEKPIYLNLSHPIIGTVARLIPLKGIAILLESFAHVCRMHPNASLVIVGDGPELNMLQQKAFQLGIANTTHFLGNRNDVSLLMREFDLFVFPTFGEGFGLVLLEAMAWEKPIVATNVLAIPEIVIHGETGLLVPPHDPLAMATAINTLIHNKEYANHLGKQGRIRLEREFTVQNMVEKTVQLYDRILESTD